MCPGEDSVSFPNPLPVWTEHLLGEQTAAVEDTVSRHRSRTLVVPCVCLCGWAPGHRRSPAPPGTLGDSVMTLTFIALLSLGLCGGPWDQVWAEALPRPSLWADPGPMVSKGSPVTLWCQGSLRADAYTLYKERRSEPRLTRIPQASSNKTEFRIPSTTSHDAGLYECAYSAGRTLSERSEPLVLVVTGAFSAPSLEAQPSPVVTAGGNVSLVCSSQSSFGPFHLLKEGGAEPARHMASQWSDSHSSGQAVFPVGPVSASHGGTYRCYASPSSYPNVWSHPSDPLRIEVTGLYRSPSLRAQPGSLLLPGDYLTLQCRSEPGFDRFALTKDEGPTPPQHLLSQGETGDRAAWCLGAGSRKHLLAPDQTGD
ncbi:leukocyte immunoglobulin-like receptor subfamily A member 6 [Pteronotus mesoamericanus]|uniref:leukocyte immunoglobulin-like receptor subfamily A member 6 n=1 Tax=Pteronotus mesoamericanus TaxID=1884717 RepID=UPI0023EC9034|nr:leukocyte immunoglobulin-like receptor subfamily A member 6 [Pteronotus parnellii mesoamericanus]